VLCPYDHGSVLFENDLEWPRKWDQLSNYQRCLWMVDEVEARWESLVAAHPKLAIFELNWATGEDLNAAVHKTGEFLQERLMLNQRRLGLNETAAHYTGTTQTRSGGKPFKIKARHHEIKNQKLYRADAKLFSGEYETYWRIMDYSEEALHLIRKLTAYSTPP
jgi:hypothetical protein